MTALVLGVILLSISFAVIHQVCGSTSAKMGRAFMGNALLAAAIKAKPCTITSSPVCKPTTRYERSMAVVPLDVVKTYFLLRSSENLFSSFSRYAPPESHEDSSASLTYLRSLPHRDGFAQGIC